MFLVFIYLCFSNYVVFGCDRTIGRTQYKQLSIYVQSGRVLIMVENVNVKLLVTLVLNEEHIFIHKN